MCKVKSLLWLLTVYLTLYILLSAILSVQQGLNMLSTLLFSLHLGSQLNYVAHCYPHVLCFPDSIIWSYCSFNWYIFFPFFFWQFFKTFHESSLENHLSISRTRHFSVAPWLLPFFPSCLYVLVHWIVVILP